MSAFDQFPGILLNGRLISTSEINSGHYAPNDDFEKEVLEFCAVLFDKKSRCTVTTSGSTGEPKSLEFPKSAFHQSANATNQFFALDRNSVALLALPIQYIAGKMMVSRSIAGGYHLKTAAPSALPLINAKGIDFLPITPYQARQSLENTPEALREVGAVLIGGGQVDEALRAELIKLGVRAYASFGMTETLSHFAIADLGIAEQEVIYKPLSNVELKVDKNGCLKVRWMGIARRWLHTNDLVEMRKEGFTWLGRADNLINSGGIKVIPEKVEKKLAHLISAAFFIAGRPHPRLGEEVCLYVENRVEETPYIDLTEIQHSLSDTPFWQPRSVVFLEKFDYTESGKIKRLETLRKNVVKPA